MNEHDLYLAARAKTDPDERTSYLDAACGGDQALRQRIESLLTEPLDPQRDTLAPGAAPPGATGDQTFALDAEPASPETRAPESASPSDWIGPYKLLQTLGEGGMGVVYLAEQERPLRRRVALKIIRPGRGSAAIIARFEAERQALALMDHPNIAKVLDAGSTRDDRPYFVMELVEGVPLTRYCDDNRLTVRERLGLFVPVCRAIQHAHQKGIIHRDVKPSNVLVSAKEGRPVPKVIDFGLAKATDQQLTDDTFNTQFGTVIGTLEYMSPEQAEMSPGGVDTRSDIYSLGVLLYELLSGSTPLSRSLLRSSKFPEMLRIIREEEPPPPSGRLANSDQLPGLAARRRTDPAKLRRTVRGELDWIATKALDKDRTRRYESADALARDVEHYLRDEPVEASPPSASYRLGKFARKHRGLLTVAGAFATVLVAATTLSTWSAVRATRAENEAREEKKRADEQKANAEAVSDFLRNDLLARASAERQARPGVRPDRDLSVRTLLDRAADQIPGRFDGKPLVEATIRQTIGNTYYLLGLYPQGETHLERARALFSRELGDSHPDALSSVNNLALLYEAQGKYDKAEPLLRQVVEIRRNALGDEHADTLTYMNNLGLLYRAKGRLDLAEPLLTRVLEVRRRALGEEHPDTLASCNNLALLYESQGKYDQAVPLLTHTLNARHRTLGDEHPNTLTSLHNLAQVYRTLGQFALAKKMLVQALEGRRRVLGEDHPDTVTSLSGLALLYSMQRQFADAEKLFRQALDIRRRTLGEEHPQTLGSLTNLGLVYESMGDFAKAEPLLKSALDGRKKVFGPHHPDTLVAMNNLGGLYLNLRQFDKAEPLVLGALEAQRHVSGPNHPGTLAAEASAIRLYEAKGDFAKAEPLLAHALERWRQGRGSGSAEVAAALTGLGNNRIRQGKFAESEAPLRESLRLYTEHSPNEWPKFYAQSLLGGCLVGQKRYDEAEPLLLEGFEGLKRMKEKLPADGAGRLAESAEWLVQLYQSVGKKDEAERWRAESTKVKESAKKP
jgi:serine/threonine protein kinase/tetratricopeptide (TPR) repeat protein